MKFTINKQIKIIALTIALIFSWDANMADNIRLGIIKDVTSIWPSTEPDGLVEIRVKFLKKCTISDEERQKIEKWAKEWEQYAYVRFKFVSSDQRADIRIINTDNPDDTQCLLVGNESARDGQEFASMILSLHADSESHKRRLVIHEFGHALGLMHEQSNPGLIDEVIDPHFVYKVFPIDVIQLCGAVFSTYDRKSIMHYRVKSEAFKDGKAIDFNYNISDGDMEFMKDIYPFPIDRNKELNTPPIYSMTFNSSIPGNKIDVRLSMLGYVILHIEFAKQPLDNSKENLYMITDESDKRYFFTSKTTFPENRVYTSVRGKFKIYKNNQQIFSNF